MLRMPSGASSLIKLIGIDPGSSMLGVAVLTVELGTCQIVSSDAWTLNGGKLAGKDSWISELHGERFSRIHVLEKNLLQIFNYHQPYEISSESPFINNKFPQAGIVLTEVVAGIRSAVRDYDPWKALHLVDPPSVKKAVGAPGNAQKEIVKEKVMQLPNLNYQGFTPIQCLDEHSIDALAVVYSRYKLLLEKLCLTT